MLSPHNERAQPAACATGDPGALDGIRVLDLTDGALQYCGKLLAQAGAEVTLVEPPGGCATRRSGPFIDDRVHIEHSLPFAYFNQGKRGVCIDLDSPEGQPLLHELARNADLLIHSYSPQGSGQAGVDAQTLQRINPRLVVTSITGFGVSGPYANYQYNDLVGMAMGGLLYLGGYADTEPVGAPGDQALLAAAQFAAVSSVAALLAAERDGTGEFVDVSVQECVAMALENAVQFVDLEQTVRKRNGGEQRQAGTGVFPCKDGLVYLMAGGIASNRFWAATANWLNEGGAPLADDLRADCWNDQPWLLTQVAKERFAAVFLPYAARFTKAELYEQAQRRRIPLCPVSTTADLLTNRQLAHRQYFVDVEHPASGRTLTCPGAPFRMSKTAWRAGLPAPRLGEHTAQALAGLGYDAANQAVMLRAGVTA